MKTTFELELGQGDIAAGSDITISIIGTEPESKPYVAVYANCGSGATKTQGWIADKDLERFAVNILKAIGSKKLKP